MCFEMTSPQLISVMSLSSNLIIKILRKFELSTTALNSRFEVERYTFFLPLLTVAYLYKIYYVILIVNLLAYIMFRITLWQRFGGFVTLLSSVLLYIE